MIDRHEGKRIKGVHHIIYRYLWDVAISAAGVSPFRYSSEQVQTAVVGSVTDEDLLKLLEMRDRHPEVAESLDRDHLAKLPTIYPPVSQGDSPRRRS